MPYLAKRSLPQSILMARKPSLAVPFVVRLKYPGIGHHPALLKLVANQKKATNQPKPLVPVTYSVKDFRCLVKQVGVTAHHFSE